MNYKRGETKKVSKVAGQFLKVALIFSILEKILPRNLYILKSILIEGTRVRHPNRLVPLSAEGDGPTKGFLEQPQAKKRRLK
jgi:hypothetical protein